MGVYYTVAQAMRSCLAMCNQMIRQIHFENGAGVPWN